MAAMAELFNVVWALPIHFVLPSLPQYIGNVRSETLNRGGRAL